jgi:hypothetical protein
LVPRKGTQAYIFPCTSVGYFYSSSLLVLFIFVIAFMLEVPCIIIGHMLEVFLTCKIDFFYACYTNGYSLDPYVVLPTLTKKHDDLDIRCNQLEKVAWNIYNLAF